MPRNKNKSGQNGINKISGRPPKYSTAKQLLDKVNAYFDYVKGEKGKRKEQVYDEFAFKFVTKEVEYWIREPEPPTITGLTLFLGYCQRNSLDYMEAKPIFSHIIKSARKRVEYNYELNLHTTKPVGAIFALKNMGWKDKLETGITDKDGNDVTPYVSLPTEALKQMESILSKYADSKNGDTGNS